MGIVAYAFLANSKPTKNRPTDEFRFQAKYGANDNALHYLWQDPLGLYTTLFLGISPTDGFVVSFDPVFHSPLYFYSSYEFKLAQVEEIKDIGRTCWEREHLGSRADRRRGNRESEEARDSSQLRAGFEVVVGCTRNRFLSLIRFERGGKGLDQGNRQLLFERAFDIGQQNLANARLTEPAAPAEIADLASHPLLQELALTPDELLSVIAEARRLKMAVRGWVAEEHLRRAVSAVDGVSGCIRLDEEGGPDLRLSWNGSRPILIECKNVLRRKNAAGLARIDFQRTRAAKGDPCSRYYAPDDFDLVAACLHAVTEKWEFKFRPSTSLMAHKTCVGKIASNLLVDSNWTENISDALSLINFL
jgi:hypothetical protein